MITIPVRGIEETANSRGHVQLLLNIPHSSSGKAVIEAQKTLSLCERFSHLFCFYQKVRAQLDDGTSQIVWVASSSVRRYRNLTQRALNHSVRDLVAATQKCSENGLAKEEARAILARATHELAKKELDRKISYKKLPHPRQISRNMLILTGEGGKKEGYLLMTRTTHMGDKLLGKGFQKKAKYAIRLNPENEREKRLLVVGTIRKRPSDKDPLTPLLLLRIREEINLLAKMRDLPNIVRLENSFEDASKFYLLMENCERGDLSKLFKQAAMGRVALSFEQKVQWAVDFGLGIEQLLRRGFYYRDVKPANFLLTEEGRGKIGDLGFATSTDDLERLSKYCGTLTYLSPDLIRAHFFAPFGSRKKAAKVADSWAFGMVLYRLFNSQHQWPRFFTAVAEEEFDKEKARRQIRDFQQDEINAAIETQLGRNTPEEIRSVIQGLLQVDPKHRWPISEAVKSLQRFANNK